MKQPDQSVSSLEIYSTVLNIGSEQTAGLRKKLTGRRGDTAPNLKDVRKVLRPAQSPRADITFAQEVINLHQYLGLTNIEKAHLDELRSFMQSVLRVHLGGDVIEPVDMLPPQLDEMDDGLVLSVAGNEALASARGVARAAFGSYYHVSKIPEEVWVGPDDGLITRVRLGESTGPSSHDLLRQLYVELLSDDALLPPIAEMDNLKVIPHLPTAQ